jgi:hypothetical protein
MDDRSDALVDEAVRETINGFMAEHRTAGRAAGLSRVRATIPLAKLQERVRSRIEGLRWPHDAGVEPTTALDEAIANLETPTIAELRDMRLPAILAGSDARITDDALELEVVIPPPRKAHAR